MSAPVGRDATAGPLLAARSLALYLLSLHAVAAALLAWEPERSTALPALLGPAALLAAALTAGEALAPRLVALPERRRLRVVGTTGYLALVAMAMLAALGGAGPGLIAREALLFAYLQPGFLLFTGLSRGDLGALQNALVLVALAALRGGPVAAAAVTGYLALLVFFLAFDHFARQVSAYPTGRVRLVGAAFREAVSIAAPLAIGLAALLALAPSRPHAGPPAGASLEEVTQQQIAAAYGRLLLLGIAGGLLVWVVDRLLRRRREERRPPQVEWIEPERGADEVLPEAARPGKVAYPGNRGRVVRAYVRFLSQAARLGFRRRPSQTPLEFAAQLPAPPAPLEALTGLFMGARYGPDEPGEAEARAAERAAEATAAGLARRRGASAARSGV